MTNPKYAHYTVVYTLTILNLDKTHPGAKKLLKGNGISVNRSSSPSSKNAVNITVDDKLSTIMQSHKEGILASAETTLLTIGGAHQGILGPALCKPHWNWQRWTLQQAVHTKMSDIPNYHKMWKQQEKLLKPL